MTDSGVRPLETPPPPPPPRTPRPYVDERAELLELVAEHANMVVRAGDDDAQDSGARRGACGSVAGAGRGGGAAGLESSARAETRMTSLAGVRARLGAPRHRESAARRPTESGVRAA